jgi:hypothetical protein
MTYVVKGERVNPKPFYTVTETVDSNPLLRGFAPWRCWRTWLRRRGAIRLHFQSSAIYWIYGEGLRDNDLGLRVHNLWFMTEN